MLRRAGLLFAATALVGGLAGCVPRFHGEAMCVPYHPRDPVALIWSEDIDDFMASVENFAPPRLEVMSDGRVIANATAVQVLSPAAVGVLTHRIEVDLGTPNGGFSHLALPRQDGRGEQGVERISVWPAAGASAHGDIFYRPLSSSAAAGKGGHGVHGLQSLDAGLPPAWRDAVDTLNTLTLQTLVDGTPYQASQIAVFASYDDNFYTLISGGQLVKGTGVLPWPAGLPRVRAYQPGDSSEYPLQGLWVSGPGVAVAQHAFVRYLHWPATLQLYDDGIAGQHYSWYGLWRPKTPSEQSPSAEPNDCARSVYGPSKSSAPTGEASPTTS